MILAQLTDMHIKDKGLLAYQKVDTSAALEAALAHLERQSCKIDVVLFTGDLVDSGRASEYARLRVHLEALNTPFFLMPGNHDDRTALRAAFPDHTYLGHEDEPVYYTIEQYPLRIIALDSLMPGRGEGQLGTLQLNWLAERLAEQPNRPTLVAVHHPPFPTFIGHMDRLGLTDSATFEDIITRHKQVERVISGHIHRPIFTRWAGGIASTAPSTAHQVALDLRADASSAFMLEPAGYQLHHFTRATGVTTHTALVGNWPGPFPFFDSEGRLIE
ncbi:phosphodiesterase [Acidocella aminolytica]|jgi:3',5'-cyclic AMP phosphodiesterase CpdA|uniref:Metallophosphoesterase n=1 Tax=Acidocella aminolytica 101 = DSM 11237 TaxID=1120923 RepID=A0A0D6PHB8_9PROT|nr:phosphodiesterase [Acidocella aminolytica]GAN80766.1 metallophosphoesterase [Acidocella aminolytica 101 = DSM 11237]GBQ36511.1 metallophosphoesterase [Acidocella aminolytica 101 = DSM 11237]SHF51780.1 Calcineurin-like phosphoesterase [Acidocella aminolytica 101 = DSM 11237]